MCIMSNAANVPLEDKQCHPQLKCCLLVTRFINYDVIRKLDSNHLEKQKECLKCKLELGFFFFCLFSIGVNSVLIEWRLPLSKQDTPEHTSGIGEAFQEGCPC